MKNQNSLMDNYKSMNFTLLQQFFLNSRTTSSYLLDISGFRLTLAILKIYFSHTWYIPIGYG
jgi:hypothetical protein